MKQLQLVFILAALSVVGLESAFARGSSFSLSLNQRGLAEDGLVLKLESGASGCLRELAGQRKSVSSAVCETIADLAASASKEASSAMTPHSPHYEIVGTVNGKTFSKRTPISVIKACDASGRCESNADVVKSQPRLQKLKDALLKLAETTQK
ncbi:MAG: hypothetical protein EOP05_11285 [Proteobacteria bacterium]|nr:MAG: hypothetical protein EOP05_11285 [Pseudomonadota bacterium]